MIYEGEREPKATAARPVFQEDNNFIRPILSPPVSTLSNLMNMYAGRRVSIYGGLTSCKRPADTGCEMIVDLKR